MSIAVSEPWLKPPRRVLAGAGEGAGERAEKVKARETRSTKRSCWTPMPTMQRLLGVKCFCQKPRRIVWLLCRRRGEGIQRGVVHTQRVAKGSVGAVHGCVDVLGMRGEGTCTSIDRRE